MRMRSSTKQAVPIVLVVPKNKKMDVKGKSRTRPFFRRNCKDGQILLCWNECKMEGEELINVVYRSGDDRRRPGGVLSVVCHSAWVGSGTGACRLFGAQTARLERQRTAGCHAQSLGGCARHSRAGKRAQNRPASPYRYGMCSGRTGL